ncbi:MAG: DUF1127 domain-containing protein [Rhodospirillales bacterium]|jgi:uncharacterized protein YjiS (DUF1127 family)|nr:DUF1127 domain-containing protein [Rhodospirillales bacterium]
MRMNILNFVGPLASSFTAPRSIRRIATGLAVDETTARELRGLNERTLRDIGFTSY